MELPIGIADGHDIAIDAQELVTGRTCIIAQSGAGKSWGIAVLCEQLLQMISDSVSLIQKVSMRR